jgi:uncharacterized membrane protein
MITTLAAAALSLALAELPPAATASKLNETEFNQAKKGEVVVKGETFKTSDGKDGARGKAWVVIDAAPDTCLNTLMKYEDAPTYMPRLKKVDIKKVTPDSWTLTQDVKVMLSTYTYTLDVTWNREKKTMAWVLDPKTTNDIKDTTGSWEFRPLPDNKTLLEYGITLDSGKAVPQFISDYMTQKDLPEVLLSFKRRVESGGKWTKD